MRIRARWDAVTRRLRIYAEVLDTAWGAGLALVGIGSGIGIVLQRVAGLYDGWFETVQGVLKFVMPYTLALGMSGCTLLLLIATVDRRRRRALETEIAAMHVEMYERQLDLLRVLVTSHGDPPRTTPELGKITYDNCVRAILSWCAQEVEHETESPVHVCLKELDANLKVRTLARAHVGGVVERARRDRHARPYDYAENTAFAHILNGASDHFIENDLWALHANGEYLNSHEGWQQHYRATLVLGIPADAAGYWGFLAADSINGKFTNRSVFILRRYALIINALRRYWNDFMMEQSKKVVALIPSV